MSYLIKSKEDLLKKNTPVNKNNYKFFDLLVISSNPVFNPDDQEIFTNKHFTKIEDSYENNKKLIEILSVSSIDLNKRLGLTHEIPCGDASTKIKCYKVEDYQPEEGLLQPLEVIVANNLESDLFHYLINGLRYYFSCQHPVILSEGKISKDIIRDLSRGFKEFFRTDDIDGIEYYIYDLFRYTERYNLRFFSINLFDAGDLEKYSTHIKKKLANFNTAIEKKVGNCIGDTLEKKRLDYATKVATKFLFINANTATLINDLNLLNKEFEFIDIQELPVLSDSLDKDQLNTWIDRYFGTTQKEKRNVKQLLNFTSLIDQPPKSIIQNNCSAFSLPEEKFFNLT